MAMGFTGGRGGRRRARGGRAPMAEINVTPLVDVMLVLLIIFMVTAPLLKAAVPIELPESRAKAMAEEARQITITLRRDGAIFVDTAQLAPGELADRLANVPPGPDGKPPLVTLRADKALDYGTVMGVMGELNRAGFTSISLVTDVSGGSGGQR
ncbi:ExbD/TolR family protein [Novosphingobium album (ex Liu et al. 2023)]|uniref:ExbD/TolR family protein n=1 Tax=Novosphingobium album (ex Liu et al. 2023) TaxID=3031130 RepID=A0ABT5WJK3_9SPHN|nr:ExbD/TolR family protein [Novosphingobium album (ex Liu et al. 2023)]MDE8650227.1 ExbD/TolR family protein [Novosphingobium album (ex Liu et al. 2023)]